MSTRIERQQRWLKHQTLSRPSGTLSRKREGGERIFLSLTAGGFTLLEMLLVLVIISVMVYAAIGYVQQRTLNLRIDKATLQIQQILNAGLAYYVGNGTWPADIDELRQKGYLPPPDVAFQNPWGQPYAIAAAPVTAGTPAMLYVYTRITQETTSGSAAAAANVIAGTLPLAYTTAAGPAGDTPPPAGSTCSTDNNCYVVASVNIPGQNLNNARAINFAGLYHHGACVPVPQCPVDATGKVMVPQVIVAPLSVSGINNPNDFTTSYPITSFTAYATGSSPLDKNPPACAKSTTRPACDKDPNGPVVDQYWRVCLEIITEKGDVQKTRTDDWGQKVTLMAVTRCAVQNEPAGSGFTVYSN
ncbi:MAG TPA: type II secretion system protein [Gammaproteobacteria bacterium]|jgi:competence protein ComGC|nr:type II secretion system protein [Gammaproteobacteria bacterium]